MKIELRARRTGKTTEAIKKAAATNSYIVTASKADSDRIFQHSKVLGINIRFPVTFAELQQAHMKTGFIKDLVIDDLDRILAQLFPHHRINMITMSINEDQNK